MQLLSGLIGAIIGATITVAYFHLSEQKKLRADVLLDVVDYCDNVYQRLIKLQLHKDHTYTQKEPYPPSGKYRAINDELTVLLISSKVAAKLAFAYGEGDTMATFNQLRSQFRQVSTILRTATKNSWHVDNRKISHLFETTIDPLRENLETTLQNQARLTAIAPAAIQDWVALPYKLIKNLKKRAS